MKVNVYEKKRPEVTTLEGSRPLQPEGVEQRDQIGRQALLLVTVVRRCAPAEAAQVRADDPVVLGQRRNHMPPLPPVLGPTVEQNHRLAAARLRHVDHDAVGLHERMPDATVHQEGLCRVERHRTDHVICVRFRTFV